MTAEQLKSLVQGLDQHFYGRMQVRNGYKTDLNSFCIARVEQRAPYRLEGHLSGPGGKNAEFSVSVDATTRQVLIHVKSKGLAGCSREVALKEITHALTVMIIRTAKGPIEGQIGTKHWRGYYLVNLGNRTIGKTGRAHFDEAIRVGVISSAFKDKCLEYGFTMKKCA